MVAAGMRVGGNGASGDLVLFGSAATVTDTTAQATVHIDGTSGRLRLTDGAGKNRAMIDGSTGNMALGGNGRDGNLFIFPAAATHVVGEESIRLRGDVGEILLRNADSPRSSTSPVRRLLPGPSSRSMMVVASRHRRGPMTGEWTAWSPAQGPTSRASS